MEGYLYILESIPQNRQAKYSNAADEYVGSLQRLVAWTASMQF